MANIQHLHRFLLTGVLLAAVGVLIAAQPNPAPAPAVPDEPVRVETDVERLERTVNLLGARLLETRHEVKTLREKTDALNAKTERLNRRNLLLQVEVDRLRNQIDNSAPRYGRR